MIELRWLKRKIKDLHPLTNTWNNPNIYETVLQYRTIQNPLEIGLHQPIFPGWKDVPTVEEK